MKQTEKQPKQIEFQFVSVRTEQKFDCFEDTLGSILGKITLKPHNFNVQMLLWKARCRVLKVASVSKFKD
jgi:hypothetical protein